MSGIGRASVLIGAGTIVSRLTGFLRTIVLVAAIGEVGKASDAFGVANQLPNNIYAILATGLVAAVIVPQIVKAATSADGGRAFTSKLFTLSAVALLATTALAMLAAPWLIQLYAPEFSADQQALATAFAYWCLPQILFYGLYAVLGEILNARNVFGPFTWAPIVNNVVSIAGFAVFMITFGGPRNTLVGWTPEMVAVLGGTATIGIAVQAIILFFFWRRAGLHLRPDFRWKGVGLGQIGRLAGWTSLMVVVGQIAGLIQSRVMSPATGVGPANFASGNAWLLFMLPYSIIVVSIGTPYFTRLSEHAKAGRDEDVRRDVGQSIRVLGLFVVIATAALAVAAVPASRILTSNVENAVAVAYVLLAFLISLVPLAVLFVVQRTFYAYDDTRTPFLFTVVQALLVISTAVIAGATLPLEYLAAGIALGQSIASTVQVLIATWLLHRRLGGIAIRAWTGALLRFAVAAIPAAAAGWGVFLLMGGVGGWTTSDKFLGALGAAIIGAVCIAVYVGVLALMRAPELAPALGMVKRFLPGSR